MSVVTIKIDEGSSYTIDLKDEYTTEEFIAVFDSYIKTITLIVASQRKLHNEMDVSKGLDNLNTKVDQLQSEVKKSIDRVTAIMMTDDASISPEKD
jgi:hypothetical protein